MAKTQTCNTMHIIDTQEIYEGLMRQGEIAQGDMCFILDDGEEAVESLSNLDIEEILNNFA